jgi:ATP-binding cassette subfamily F protein 3
MLEKLVIVQVDEVDNSALNFPATVRSGQYPVIVKD